MSAEFLTSWAILALVQLELDPHAIGYPCEQVGCCDVARWLVPWPGREPSRMCQRHYEYTLTIADVMTFRTLITLGTRPLDVGRINDPEQDPSAQRFAAMELV